MSLKDNLKYWREQKGYDSAKDFANSINMPYHKYVSYEKESWPNEENLVKIATALNVSIDDLIGYKNDELKRCAEFLDDGFKMIIPPGEDYIYIGMFTGNNMDCVKVKLDTGKEENYIGYKGLKMDKQNFIDYVHCLEKQAHEESVFNISMRFQNEIYRQIALNEHEKKIHVPQTNPKGYHPEPPRTETPTHRKKE